MQSWLVLQNTQLQHLNINAVTERDRASEMQVGHQRLPAGGKRGTAHEQRREQQEKKEGIWCSAPEITRNFPKVEQIVYHSLKRGRIVTGGCEVSQ